MPLKKIKKEIQAQVAQSFAQYFEETGDKCQFKWLGSADEDVDEDNPLEAENNVLKSIDVHDETNARSLPKVTENEKQHENQLAAPSAEKNLSQLNSTEASVDPVSPDISAVETVNDNSDDATIQNISHPIEDNSKSESIQNQHRAADIDDNDAASTVSDQLRKYITLYDQKGTTLSSIEDKEFEDLVGGQVESDKIEVSNCRPETSTAVFDSQNERSYDILQDAQNPMVFHICPKRPDSETPFNRRMIRLRGESITYDGSELRRCFIPLKDFRKRYRKPNPLQNMEFFVARPQKVKRLRKTRNNQWRLPNRQPNVSKKQGKAAQRTIGTQVRDEKVEQRSSFWDAIQEAYPKPPPEITQLAPAKPTETKTISIEEKNVSIKEWLELSSQVVQSNNNVDVNELFQYGSLPMLSDIEDEAYQLSTFLDFTNNEARNANMVQSTVQVSDEAAQNAAEFPQPLDLSMKQVTPMSTDTGFCNGSSSMGVTSPYQFSLLPMEAYHSGTENRIEFTNDYAEKSRTIEAANWQPSTTQNVDPTMKLPSNTTTTQPTEKQLCDIGPRFEVTSDAKATASVAMPPETNITPQAGNTQRVVPQSDCNVDNYSTDLDYEPSEDEDDESDECHQVQSTTSSVNNDNTTPVESDEIPQVPDDPAPVFTDTTEPVESCIESGEKNEIEAVSNLRTTRSTARALLSKSLELKEIASTNVNVVEQQPTAVEEAKPMTILIKVPFTKRMVKPPPDDLLKPADKDKIGLLKDQVEYLLNRICLNYLADETCTKSICRKNHNLPSADEMLVKLKLFPTDAILCIYSMFITRNRMAFINYFPTICTIFGERKLKSQLIATVEHCDQYNKKSFYMDIYSACVRMGMFKREAMSEIARMSCKSAISCTHILNIIVKEDPEIFKQMLKDFYPLANIDSHHMLALLRRLSENPEPSLLKLFVDIFNKYSRSNVSDFGPYNMIYHEILSLVNDSPNLVRKLKYIAFRDKRLT